MKRIIQYLKKKKIIPKIDYEILKEKMRVSNLWVRKDNAGTRVHVEINGISETRDIIFCPIVQIHGIDIIELERCGWIDIKDLLEHYEPYRTTLNEEGEKEGQLMETAKRYKEQLENLVNYGADSGSYVSGALPEEEWRHRIVFEVIGMDRREFHENLCKAIHEYDERALEKLSDVVLNIK